MFVCSSSPVWNLHQFFVLVSNIAGSLAWSRLYQLLVFREGWLLVLCGCPQPVLPKQLCTLSALDLTPRGFQWTEIQACQFLLVLSETHWSRLGWSWVLQLLLCLMVCTFPSAVVFSFSSHAPKISPETQHTAALPVSLPASALSLGAKLIEAELALTSCLACNRAFLFPPVSLRLSSLMLSPAASRIPPSGAPRPFHFPSLLPPPSGHKPIVARRCPHGRLRSLQIRSLLCIPGFPSVGDHDSPARDTI